MFGAKRMLSESAYDPIMTCARRPRTYHTTLSTHSPPTRRDHVYAGTANHSAQIAHLAMRLDGRARMGAWRQAHVMPIAGWLLRVIRVHRMALGENAFRFGHTGHLERTRVRLLVARCAATLDPLSRVVAFSLRFGYLCAAVSSLLRRYPRTLHSRNAALRQSAVSIPTLRFLLIKRASPSILQIFPSPPLSAPHCTFPPFLPSSVPA